MAALALLVLAAAACSSDGESATPPTTSADGVSPTAATSPRGGDCAELAGLTGTVQDHGTLPLSGTSVDIEAGDFFFDATCVTTSSAGEITVTVTNTGSALHNFSVADQGIDKDVPVGESVTVKVELPSSGSLPFLCKYHSGAGMQGAFVVG